MLTLILMTILGSALALGALYIGVMLFGYLLLALGRWQMFLNPLFVLYLGFGPDRYRSLSWGY